VAPDHVYVHASVQDAFVDACHAVLQQRYGAGPLAQKAGADLARVVNRRHTQRLASLLADAQQRSARLLAGGEVDEEQCYIAPTLLDQVIAAINAAPKPLALYLWSTRGGQGAGADQFGRRQRQPFDAHHLRCAALADAVARAAYSACSSACDSMALSCGSAPLDKSSLALK
jgi:hypothetical protein